MFSSLPPELQQAIEKGQVALVLALLGRFLWHMRLVQEGRRRFFSMNLVWELLIALPVGLVAHGAAVYAGLSGSPLVALTIAIAYLGPAGAERLVILGLEAYRGRALRCDRDDREGRS